MRIIHITLSDMGCLFIPLLQVQHQSTSCPLRLIMCRFCGDMVHAGSTPGDARDRLRGLSEHESICGSRTTQCDSCGRSVMLKEMDIHVIAVHQKSWWFYLYSFCPCSTSGYLWDGLSTMRNRNRGLWVPCNWMLYSTKRKDKGRNEEKNTPSLVCGASVVLIVLH